MPITVSPLRLTELATFPDELRRCVFWELDPDRCTESIGDPRIDKELWLSRLLMEWGTCGQYALADGKTVGGVTYAPPGTVPRAGKFPSGPASPDAVLLTALVVDSGPALDGLAEALVDAVVADLTRRGVKAIEVFGAAGDPQANDLNCELCGCSRSRVIDADFLAGQGFVVVQPHHRYPRMRKELTDGLGWKAGVEHALEQLLAQASLTQSLVSH